MRRTSNSGSSECSLPLVLVADFTTSILPALATEATIVWYAVSKSNQRSIATPRVKFLTFLEPRWSNTGEGKRYILICFNQSLYRRTRSYIYRPLFTSLIWLWLLFYFPLPPLRIRVLLSVDRDFIVGVAGLILTHNRSLQILGELLPSHNENLKLNESPPFWQSNLPHDVRSDANLLFVFQ